MLKAYLARNRALLIAGVLALIVGLAVDVWWLRLGASAVLYLANVLPGFL